MINNIPKPVLLCVLDGFGIGDESNPSNAVAVAKMPNYRRFLKSYPNSQLTASGLDVGLPDGQIGNSEVGHMAIGAGRIIFQDLPRINNAIKDGSLAENDKVQELINNLRASGKPCHLLGLLSDGGVHSHIDHIIFFANLLTKNGVKVLIHAFLDGRDVAQKSAEKYLQKLQGFEIASISGRYFAMDRDKKWDRIQLACEAIIFAKGKKFGKNYLDAISALKNSYQKNITDEFIEPLSNLDYQGISDGDGLLFCNFRADRTQQISQALFEQRKFSIALSLTEYSEELSNFYKVIFPPIQIKNSLPEIIANRGLKQLRIAETEKYAHVTFFFSCGNEKEFSGEERILVQSPAVSTYDLKPEMSATKIGEELSAAINSNKFDFIIVNYANPDMVGHSGLLDPSVKACETIDQQLGMLEKLVLDKKGAMIISADHGNVECMLDEKQQPHTSHTTNPVPFILIGKKVELTSGNLSDIAPTVLCLLNIEKPKEMSGKNLIQNVKILKNNS
jgi:2,3-bisphosphoglycerate-independent phosphoglycerate mutase